MRARKGGEVGKNGEFYRGGTFLPSTTLPKQGSQGRVKVSHRKVLISPGELVSAREDASPIFGRIRVYPFFHDTGKFEPFPPDHKYYRYNDMDYSVEKSYIDAYNQGKRWIDADGNMF